MMNGLFLELYEAINDRPDLELIELCKLYRISPNSARVCLCNNNTKFKLLRNQAIRKLMVDKL